MSDLHILFPKPKATRVGGRTVKVYPVKLRHLADFSAAAGDLLALLADASAANLTAYGARNQGAIRQMLRRHTSLSRWQIRQLNSISAVMLACQIVEANLGFFAQAQQVAVTGLSAGQTSPSA